MIRQLYGAAALVLGLASQTTWAQKLDDSLLEQSAKDAEAQEGRWMSNWMDGMGELGGWSVWLETDVSVVEEIQGQATNNLRDAAQLGQPSWNNSKLTNVLNRMNNGFDNVVDNWGRYVPNHVRIGVSKTLQHNLSLGVQLGKAWTQAYIHCVDAEGNNVVASWNQVRHADLVDQFLFYDDLYNGNLWEFQNAGTFANGLETWRMEVCASQELTYGLGWAASLGTAVDFAPFASDGGVDPPGVCVDLPVIISHRCQGRGAPLMYLDAAWAAAGPREPSSVNKSLG